jgi:hypothetical protein
MIRGKTHLLEAVQLYFPHHVGMLLQMARKLMLMNVVAELGERPLTSMLLCPIVFTQ